MHVKAHACRPEGPGAGREASCSGHQNSWINMGISGWLLTLANQALPTSPTLAHISSLLTTPEPYWTPSNGSPYSNPRPLVSTAVSAQNSFHKWLLRTLQTSSQMSWPQSWSLSKAALLYLCSIILFISFLALSTDGRYPLSSCVCCLSLLLKCKFHEDRACLPYSLLYSHWLKECLARKGTHQLSKGWRNLLANFFTVKNI